MALDSIPLNDARRALLKAVILKAAPEGLADLCRRIARKRKRAATDETDMAFLADVANEQRKLQRAIGQPDRKTSRCVVTLPHLGHIANACEIDVGDLRRRLENIPLDQSSASSSALSSTWEQYHNASSAVSSALDQYLHRYTERYGQVKVLGMSEPIPLRRIYTELQMVDPSFLRKCTTVESLERQFVENDCEGFCPRFVERCDGTKVANELQFLNVLGEPGAGKSTFLRRIGLEALLPRGERHYKHDRIPVFLEFNALEDRKLHLPEMAELELMSFGFPEGFSNRILKEGKALVLLDGLDEIPPERFAETIRGFQLLTNQHSSNRFITSCRTTYYAGWFNRSTDVLVADLGNPQIENFVHNWFSSQGNQGIRKAAHLCAMLQLPENDGMLEPSRSSILH
jgi:hypothetical protein